MMGARTYGAGVNPRLLAQQARVRARRWVIRQGLRPDTAHGLTPGGPHAGRSVEFLLRFRHAYVLSQMVTLGHRCTGAAIPPLSLR